MPATLSHIHRYLPGTSADTLVLLHGTGGSEDDLLDLGRAVAPGSNLLSPRGKALEHGMPRFFRRLAEGVFDVPDLIARAHELADFVADAAGTYGFDPRRVAALGYSNGANIAAAVLLLRPQVFRSAVLLRPMVPLVPETSPDLSGVRALIAAGSQDPMNANDQAGRLTALLRAGGADVTLELRRASHGLVPEDLTRAAQFLASTPPPAAV